MSDTPATDPDDYRGARLVPRDELELLGPQGPADWSREPRSDDLFSEAAKARLLRELLEHDDVDEP